MERTKLRSVEIQSFPANCCKSSPASEIHAFASESRSKTMNFPNIDIFAANLKFGAGPVELSEAREIKVSERNRCRSERKRRNSKFSAEIVTNPAECVGSELLLRNREQNNDFVNKYVFVANLIFGAGSLERGA